MYASTTIVGNLGRDAEMRYTQAGEPVSDPYIIAAENMHTHLIAA